MKGPAKDVIRVERQYYIRATSALADDRVRVLKDSETFAVFDRYGDVQPVGLGEQGLYHEGTRHLSRLELRCWGRRPLILSSGIREDNSVFAVDLANPDVSLGNGVFLPRDTVHVVRFKFLWRGTCYERLWIRNLALRAVEASFSLHLDADFRDIFEVRGLDRKRRGRLGKPLRSRDGLLLSYTGLDGVARRTRIRVSPRPKVVKPREIGLLARLEPRGETNFYLTVSCAERPPRNGAGPYRAARDSAHRRLAALRSRECEIFTSNEQFNDWLNRSRADLHMMVTDTPQGPYPYAGVPWFSAAFGRDGVITGIESLWVNPDLARGVLRFLAARQAREEDPGRDAEPGKILHEVRLGEMAALGEIPFARYYGSVDVTPLFVLLAGMYYDRTGDRELAEALWPSVERALGWIDRHGDPDRDGFVEYAKRSPRGLVHQGWKDSVDAVFHADGRDARGPVALCEVQGYAYAAKVMAARLAGALEKPAEEARRQREARALRERFAKSFWCPDISTFALALDGEKRPCRVRTSNAGHCLFSGIAGAAQAAKVARTLFHPSSYSGWGIRTVAATEARYNPISYHNGSVWPHDSALIAFGLARYGHKEGALRIMSGLFDASIFVEHHRLPELFCGFARRKGEGLSVYPLACAPQAWASASVFLCLQACLGLSIDAPAGRVIFQRPRLPEYLQEVLIRNLTVRKATVDLELRRHPGGVEFRVTRRKGSLDIVVVK